MANRSVSNLRWFLEYRLKSLILLGHSIVPAWIPTGTTLYLTRTEKNGNLVPRAPAWLSFDPEHASLYCDQTCNTVVFSTYRPLRLLYHDGASAAMAIHGSDFTSMATQDLLAWGSLHPEKEYDEAGRMQALCRWGSLYGIEGFVRMGLNLRVFSSLLSL